MPMTPDLIALAAGLHGRIPSTASAGFIAKPKPKPAAPRDSLPVVEGTAAARLLETLWLRKREAWSSIAGIGEMLPGVPRDTLRSAIARLVSEGLLDTNGRNHRRRVYMLTDAGRSVGQALADKPTGARP